MRFLMFFLLNPFIIPSFYPFISKKRLVKLINHLQDKMSYCVLCRNFEFGHIAVLLYH